MFLEQLLDYQLLKKEVTVFNALVKTLPTFHNADAPFH
jgi:hypothetical protein